MMYEGGNNYGYIRHASASDAIAVIFPEDVESRAACYSVGVLGKRGKVPGDTCLRKTLSENPIDWRLIDRPRPKILRASANGDLWSSSNGFSS